ncbi:MAG: hypothetical protein IJV65_08870 [Kiritimatiellae bacterium]|nr:hypothetical protein [Kiritimatiellia bacterium]
MKLTPAQSKFARLVAEGKSFSESYRESYPRSRKWTPEAVAVEASRLAASPNVSPRIEELRRASDEESIISLRELRQALSSRFRELVGTHAPTRELCRAADCLITASGWKSPDALAVAVSGVALSPADRGRHICELLGVSLDEVRRKGHDEAWSLFQEALGIPKISQEERARRIEAILGIHEPEPEPTPEKLERRHRDFLATLTGSDEDQPEPPAPLALPAPAPRPTETLERTGIADAAVDDEPAKPGLTFKQTKILQRVEAARCQTAREVRATALSYREEGGADWDDANAVLVAWEAKRKGGAPA